MMFNPYPRGHFPQEITRDTSQHGCCGLTLAGSIIIMLKIILLNSMVDLTELPGLPGKTGIVFFLPSPAPGVFPKKIFGITYPVLFMNLKFADRAVKPVIKV